MSRRRTLLVCAGLAALALILATVVAPGPGPASAAGGMAQVAVGGHHACGVTSTGGVQCWGDSPPLGAPAADTCSGGGSCSRSPIDVSGLSSGVSAVAAGWTHTCALTAGGGVKCWGDNSDGQLGDGTTGNVRAAPVDVSGLSSGVAAVSGGAIHTCALMTGGGVKCWGDNSAG